MDLKKILKKAFDAGYNTSLMYNNLGDKAHKDFQEFYKKEVNEQLTLTDVVQQSEQYCECTKPTLGKSVSRCGNCDEWFKPLK